MKKKAYVKNQLRLIVKTKARFLSIFCIVFLGAAFFAGLRHTSIVMKTTMNDYLEVHQFNDLDYISTIGFDDSDIDLIKSNQEVESISQGYRFDALAMQDTNSYGVIAYANDNFDTVNKVEIVEGTLPTKDNECIIDDNLTRYITGVKVGDSITLSNNNGTKDFIVTGFVNDSRYFSDIERGTNSLGDGTSKGYVQILSQGNETFALPQELYDLRGKTVFNEIRIKLKNENNYNVFSDDYLEYVQSVDKDLKDKLTNSVETVNHNLVDDANKKIEEAQQKLTDGTNQYNDGMNQYNDGLKQYNDGMAKYNDGYAKYQSGLRQYQSGLSQYQDGLKEYNTNLANLNSAKADYQAGLNDYNNQYATYTDYLNQYNTGMDQYNQAIASGIPPEALADEYQKLQVLKVQLDAMKPKLDEAKQTLDATAEALATNEKKLANGKATLDATKNTLDTSKATLDSSKRQLDSSKRQLDNAKATLDNSLEQLNQAKVDLDNGQVELDKAKQQVNDIPTGELISITREENSSVLSYLSTCDSMEAIALVFPLIFFLVAALVSLTTMTRMVEEQRIQSGTFRALGYDKKDIVMQYLNYAFLATFFSCGLGIVAGVYFFPSIIYYLYNLMLFRVGAGIITTFDWLICLETYGISVAITLIVTYLVVRGELIEVPANLLRPKPPKLGKRIVLERIDFIWKRLSFNQKVTMRNIFRYKKRFFMSVIGIAGCSALIVTGFGIKHSVSTLVDMQYNEVFTSAGNVVFNRDLNNDQLNEEASKFKDLADIKDVVSYNTKMISVKTTHEYYANLEVYENKEDINRMINLTSFEDGETLSLKDDGVIISSKLSELLGVHSGDSITITVDDHDYKVKVTGITVIYFQHYIYMSDSYYHQLTNETPVYDHAYYKGDETKAVDQYVEGNANVESINDNAGIGDSFNSQMESLNSIVIILILCAGALAFIVLYNLTNINIQERKSEIATIKVLGFYPREVYDYVFRENKILAFIGSIVGLALGKLLHMFIIQAVEVEQAMFLREVGIWSYVWAILLTMIFTILINQVMKKVLRNIDMVESLKSIE